MRPSRKQPRNTGQLEFDDLIAEATDICLRMRSIRRRDFVFCPLQIPGWQTSEARRLHLTPAVLDATWLEDRIQNIKSASTTRELLIITASYIGELLDPELENQTAASARGAGYSEYCGGIIEELGSDDAEETRICVFCWETAKGILDACEQRHAFSDWELLEQLESVISQGAGFVENPEDRKTHISEIFVACLCFLHGWSSETRHTGAGERLP